MTKPEENSGIVLSPWGGAGTVTGANFEIRIPPADGIGAPVKILIDCGLHQGTPENERENRKQFAYDAKEIRALLITHAHLDHIGRIGQLVKEGFTGTIYSTRETKAIAEVSLQDAAHIEAEKSRIANVPPAFNEAHLVRAFSLWQTVSYHESTEIAPGVSVVPYDAGHILGSAMYWINMKTPTGECSLLATGDLGNSPSLLLRDTEIPPGPDFLLMESVYGDRNHEGIEEREANFRHTIEKAVENGGTILIPCFSIERTQIVLSLLNGMWDASLLPRVPVFLDSPLAIRVTHIYEKMTELFNEGALQSMNEKDGLFRFATLKETARVSDSHTIEKVLGPKIILAGSGMSSGGRILSHEARYLPDPDTTVLLMGYQAAGTVGRMLEEGAKEVMIGTGKIKVRARIISIHGFSGHKDSDHLVEFVSKLTPHPKKVFIGMGELKSASFLAQRIKDTLDIPPQVLEKGKEYHL